jgi:hypothetical protein
MRHTTGLLCRSLVYWPMRTTHYGAVRAWCGGMSRTLLVTKLYIPPPRPHLVLHPRLIERLNAGLHRKLTLISAPAGFGKTTLISEWLASCHRPAAWLSLDKGDSDATCFLTYLISALQTIAAPLGAGSRILPLLTSLKLCVRRALHATPDGTPSAHRLLHERGDLRLNGLRPL